MPIFGVLPASAVAGAYGSPLILLLLGGFILSTAMERSGVHRRVALTMVNLFGGSSGRRLVFGFMAASATLSMWISNTATTLMLLPVALAVLERTDAQRMSMPLLLDRVRGVTGGLGTPIGTPANLVFMQVYQEISGSEFSFVRWMSFGVPVVLLFLPLMGLWLTRRLEGIGRISVPEVGAWRTDEARVMIVFGLTALAWMTRKEPFGGWSTLLGVPGANDAAVAFVAVAAMFVISDGKGGRLLDWERAERIPWGMLLLFAGGITIARAFEATGISVALGETLSGLANLPCRTPRRGDLPRHHLPHGDDVQHGDHDPDDADIGGGSPRGRYRADAADDPGRHERVLRLHAAGGDSAERDHVRDGPLLH